MNNHTVPLRFAGRPSLSQIAPHALGTFIVTPWCLSPRRRRVKQRDAPLSEPREQAPVERCRARAAAFVVARGLYIAIQAPDTYSRLVAGSISLTFFVYVFVNTAMVTGLVPVVGVPLPLVSFGGTSMVTLMAGFGILMSIHSHRKFIPH